jgi:hypothetical protein
MARKTAPRSFERSSDERADSVACRKPAPKLEAWLNEIVSRSPPLPERTAGRDRQIIRAKFSPIDYNKLLKNFEKKLFELFNESDLGLSEAAMRQLARSTVEAIEQEQSFVSSGAAPSARAAMSDAAAQLPERPIREFRPRKDDIIDYIRAPDGFGPWLDAGVLTRPMIRQFSKKAYGALYDFLKKQPLPDDIVLPTRTQLTNGSLETAGLDPTDLDAARRLRALAQANLRRAIPTNS